MLTTIAGRSRAWSYNGVTETNRLWLVNRLGMKVAFLEIFGCRHGIVLGFPPGAMLGGAGLDFEEAVRGSPTLAGTGLLLLVLVVGIGADLAIGFGLGDARGFDNLDRATFGGNRMRFAVCIRVGSYRRPVTAA